MLKMTKLARVCRKSVCFSVVRFAYVSAEIFGKLDFPHLCSVFGVDNMFVVLLALADRHIRGS